MVKKILFLLIFFFIFNVSNVFAYQLPTAYTGADYRDGTYQDGTTNVASWWGTNNYLASPYKIGYFTPATSEAEKIQFLWSNLNLCPNQNLKISGKIGALFNFFTENPYHVSIFNNNEEMTCSYSLEDNSRIGFTCVGVGGGNLYIALSQLNFASHNNYDVGVSRDIDYSCEVTNLQVMQQEIINTQNIINNQNSNTQSIIQDNQQNTQDIINNQNQNTQDIIDNQNANTQAEIESQQVCKKTILTYKNVKVQGAYLDSNGNEVSSNVWGITDFYQINSLKILAIANYGGLQKSCFYNENKHLITCVSSNYPIGDYSLPMNTKYARFSIRENDVPQYEIHFCENGNQALNDTLKDDTPPDTENQLSDLDNSLISDTPITDLITLPITLLNSYITGVGGTCTSYNLGNLYGTDLILPCLNLQQRLGSNLWTIIDSLFSIFMIYNIGMLMIQAFEGFTSLRDDYEGLYQPRHADTGYQPKHGGDN